MLREILTYLRMANGIREFLRSEPIHDVRSALLARREQREDSFLNLARNAIFDRPENPYHTLFQIAGCSYADLERSVRQEGLEPALTRLYQAGVYLTHDEFKGRVPIVRFGRSLQSDPDMFANPLVRDGLESSSSGSRSRGTRTRRNIDYQLYREAIDLFLSDALGFAGRERILILPPLPALAGLRRAMCGPRRGDHLARWFALGGTLRDSGHYRAVTEFMVWTARLCGARIPSPSYLTGNDFSAAADYIAKASKRGSGCVVEAIVSPAVRVAAAAFELGLDLSGTTFLVAGEALTNAKRDVIERIGAEVLSSYVVSEIGLIGAGCRHMKRDNCVHLMDDAFAVITRRRMAPLSNVELDSLLFTTLAPFAPMALINAEMDDSAQLEPATCDCALSQFGYRRQLRNIFSYGKLTGQGTTLVGSDLLRILEEELPKRFGGSPADYQLVEREGEAQTVIELRVHPRLGDVPLDEVSRYFLGEIGKLWGGALTRREWLQTEGLRVVRAEPIAGRTGKVLPLHLLSDPL